MSRVKVNVTMSLAGFVAGPDQRAKDPLGIGGMQLQQCGGRHPYPLQARPRRSTGSDRRGRS
jgi:hypothetical protein